ncbi:hypothetical protein ACFX2F_028126 [Malus domestica]
MHGKEARFKAGVGDVEYMDGREVNTGVLELVVEELLEEGDDVELDGLVLKVDEGGRGVDVIPFSSSPDAPKICSTA